MRLFDVDFRKLDRLDPLYILKALYDVNGNCPENGFLAEEFSDCGFDDEHRLVFSTKCEKNGDTYESQGIVLTSGVLIKQKKNGAGSNCLYSWDTNNNEYTRLLFMDSDSLDEYYNVLVNKNVNLCTGNAVEKIQDLGLDIDKVQQFLEHQTVDIINDFSMDNEDKVRVK